MKIKILSIVLTLKKKETEYLDIFLFNTLNVSSLAS